MELKTDLDYLISIEIEENPIYTLVSGPITFQNNEFISSLKDLPGGIGLLLMTSNNDRKLMVRPNSNNAYFSNALPSMIVVSRMGGAF